MLLQEAAYNTLATARAREVLWRDMPCHALVWFRCEWHDVYSQGITTARLLFAAILCYPELYALSFPSMEASELAVGHDSGNITEQECIDANSIGTLTSWQILAEQLGDGANDTFSEDEEAPAVPATNTHASKSLSGNMLAVKAGIHLDLRSPSFVNPLPTLSGMFGLEEAPASFVTPKQLHVLYKEYHLLNEIGSGAFGRVCKAKRLRDGKEVVVKEIRTAHLSGKMKAATMDEVQVLAKMNHPNIVK